MRIAGSAVRVACMTDEEWHGWREANVQLSDVSRRASSPCTDCLMSFAAEMRRQGRCNGTPGEGLTGRHILPSVSYAVARRRRQVREAAARYRSRRAA